MTADPRPAPPEHADRAAIANIVWLPSGNGGSGELADKILAWIKEQGFARITASVDWRKVPEVIALKECLETHYLAIPDEIADEITEKVERAFRAVVKCAAPSVGSTPSPEGGP